LGRFSQEKGEEEKQVFLLQLLRVSHLGRERRKGSGRRIVYLKSQKREEKSSPPGDAGKR